MTIASYWATPEKGVDVVDYGLPHYEALDWLATADHGFEGPGGRIDLAEEVHDDPRGSFAEIVQRQAVGDGDLYVYRDHPALSANYRVAPLSPAQNTRLIETVAHLDHNIENQARDRGILGYHDHGHGVIEARFHEFLEEVGYREQLATALVTVYAAADPQLGPDQLAYALDRRYSEWAPNRNVGEYQVGVQAGDVSPLSGSGTALNPEATVDEARGVGGVTEFLDSANRGGFVLSDENNQMIPQAWRTSNGVYEWSKPARGPLEAQPGNSAAVEMIFAKELAQLEASSTRHPAAAALSTRIREEALERPDTKAADSAAMFASLLRDQDPRGWQETYGETPIRLLDGETTPTGMGAPQAPGTAVLDYDSGTYEPCTLGELREAMDRAAPGKVLDYLAESRRAVQGGTDSEPPNPSMVGEVHLERLIPGAEGDHTAVVLESIGGEFQVYTQNMVRLPNGEHEPGKTGDVSQFTSYEQAKQFSGELTEALYARDSIKGRSSELGTNDLIAMGLNNQFVDTRTPPASGVEL